MPLPADLEHLQLHKNKGCLVALTSLDALAISEKAGIDMMMDVN